MKVKRGWKGFLGLVGLLILIAGLSACSTKAATSESPPENGSLDRQIKVYESPT